MSYETEESVVLEGTVEKINFQNEMNGYTVLELNDGQQLTTAVGTMPHICAGEQIIVEGFYQTHPVFGRQLKVRSCERKLPTSENAIYLYLSSGAVKGIGPATAETLMKHFKSLKRIKEAPYSEIEALIGKAKARLLMDGLN